MWNEGDPSPRTAPGFKAGTASAEGAGIGGGARCSAKDTALAPDRVGRARC